MAATHLSTVTSGDPNDALFNHPRAVGVGAETRDYRAALMHSLMDELGLDALAFSSPTWFKFATNFDMDVSGFERPALCVIPRNGQPFVILHELSQNHWRLVSAPERRWVSEVEFYSEHPRVDNRLPLVSQWPQLAAAMLEARGLGSARIGTDGSIHAPVAAFLPQVRFENVERACRKMRWIKHREEIGVMAALAELADWGQECYRSELRAGRLVAELDHHVAGLMAQEAARRMPGTDLAIYCWTLSGPVSASPHGYSAFGNLAGASVESGHGIVTCIYPAIDGLFVENERTWFCGAPNARQIELFEAARLANLAACEAAIAGRPVWSVDAAAQSVFERAGVADLICHRTGHGLGIGAHDYPVDMAFNCEPMPEGLVLSVEPGIYEFGLGGFRHDDTVVVGPEPRLLTHTSKDLNSQTIL